MSHIRQAIRDDITLVLTGLATTGENVFQSHVYPLEDASLPGVCIFFVNESIDYATMGSSRTQVRTATFMVEGYVKAISSYDDVCDDITSEVEIALKADLTRDGYAMDTRVTNVAVEYSDEGNQPLAMVSVTVEVEYHTVEGQATT